MNDPISTTTAAWCSEADAALGEHRWEEAVTLYRRVLSVDQANADVWFNLGYALRQAGRFEEAIAAYAGALSNDVADPQEVHLNRAAIYSDHLFRNDAALAELRTAISLRDDYAPAWLNLGNLEEEQGNGPAAIACYEKVLQLEGDVGPLGATAAARMAHLVPPKGPTDGRMAQLRRLAQTTRYPEVAADLWFALGQAYEQMSSFDQAFDAFERGNAICRWQGAGYDPRAQEHMVDSLMDCFQSRMRAPGPGSGVQPMFICGMFRSGSTLLEQVLSGHPAIAAAGELDWLPRLVRGPLRPFPWSMPALAKEDLDKYSRGYLEQLRQLPIGKQGEIYVIDKRPDNFMLIGLIKSLFPGAKILHTVRHPMDNGLSIFKQHLGRQVAPYSSSLEDISHYYIQYRRIMAYWKSVYSSDILDVDYDVLVRSPREVISGVLGFLGLEWSAEVLQFHLRPSTVKTASYWQVRRPLYGEASGRWRHYARPLRPLAERLQLGGVLLPEDAAFLGLVHTR